MPPMKQKIIHLLLVLFILLLGACVVGIFVLDGVAQSIIQSKGSEGLGVEVKMANVHVGFFGSDTTASSITNANPTTFASELTPDLLTIKKNLKVLLIFQQIGQKDLKLNLEKI